jgi:hypothetical protein
MCSDLCKAILYKAAVIKTGSLFFKSPIILEIGWGYDSDLALISFSNTLRYTENKG